MRLEWAAVLAPVVAAIPIGFASWVINLESMHPLLVISALVVGSPVAVAYSIATSYFLRDNLLRSGRMSYLFCALWGTALAAITAPIIAGDDPLVFALIAWGAVSGILFRAMSGIAPT